MSEGNPVLVEILRGDEVEAWHRGAWCARRDERIVASVGDQDRRYCLRSSAKFFQALPHLLAGADQRYGVSEAELALLCASHGGEERHVALAARLLERAGLDAAALDCGAHAPMHLESRARLLAEDRAPDPLHNNCSGKHAGMILAALARSESIEDYLSVDHPLQREIRRLLGLLAGVDLEQRGGARDGCSAPTFYLSLDEAARAYQRFARPPEDFGRKLRQACFRLSEAVSRQPAMIAGAGRFCSALASVSSGRLLCKVGAEGFYGAFCRATGTGIALHVDDGAASASERVLVAVLAHLDLIRDDEVAQLAPFVAAARANHAGRPVGVVRVHPEGIVVPAC